MLDIVIGTVVTFLLFVVPFVVSTIIYAGILWLAMKLTKVDGEFRMMLVIGAV